MAGEAKNKLWSSHREPCWTEQISVKIFCRGKSKQENGSHAKCLDLYASCFYRTIMGQPISRSINILKDVKFTQANKTFEVVCKSYYKRGNPKPQHKNPLLKLEIWRKNLYFSNDCPSSKNLCGSTFVITWAGEEGKVDANLQRTRSSSSTTIKTMSMSL